jgi:hypothetical protein
MHHPEDLTQSVMVEKGGIVRRPGAAIKIGKVVLIEGHGNLKCSGRTRVQTVGTRMDQGPDQHPQRAFVASTCLLVDTTVGCRRRGMRWWLGVYAVTPKNHVLSGQGVDSTAQSLAHLSQGVTADR